MFCFLGVDYFSVSADLLKYIFQLYNYVYFMLVCGSAMHEGF